MHWRRQGAPIQGLGEYWTARMFAAATDREFVDARHVLGFDNQGRVNSDSTSGLVRDELRPDRRYVVPGFYGADSQGRMRVLERGGSDVTGALIARGLDATSYDIWSDVDGLMNANPNNVPVARLRPQATLREMREMANGGAELVHRDAIRYMQYGRTPIRLWNSFGQQDAPGTIISGQRDWAETPVIGVTSRDDLMELAIHEFGLNEQVGATTELYETLAKSGVPYEHILTSLDDLSVIFRAEYRNKLPYQLHGLNSPQGDVRLRCIGLVSMVGEGLAQSGTVRSQTLGQAATALSNAGIEHLTTGGAPNSVSAMFYVDTETTDIQEATRVVHNAVCEE
ncbi:MAG TPA: hypothetical protein VJC09_00020 [Candidatus Saccharimonadales bacterium]|nr:hypothetical protein [Candidatus Saccharimonadales bacterium]